MKDLILWNVYEIKTESTPINGVMLRGRIRKLALENNQNILTENTSDIDSSVRFAVISDESADFIIKYLKSIIDDVSIKLILENIKNPVLSKLKVNKEDRYTL